MVTGLQKLQGDTVDLKRYCRPQDSKNKKQNIKHSKDRWPGNIYAKKIWKTPQVIFFFLQQPGKFGLNIL